MSAKANDFFPLKLSLSRDLKVSVTLAAIVRIDWFALVSNWI